jgi:hypothetical protein
MRYISLKALLVLTLAGCAVASHACSCVGARAFTGRSDWAHEAFTSAAYIAHVQVVSVLPGKRARIRVLERFKGSEQLQILQALDAESSMCGTGFAPGEEFVAWVERDTVNLCGKLFPEESLLKALRRLAAATTSTKETKK